MKAQFAADDSAAVTSENGLARVALQIPIFAAIVGMFGFPLVSRMEANVNQLIGSFVPGQLVLIDLFAITAIIGFLIRRRVAGWKWTEFGLDETVALLLLVVAALEVVLGILNGGHNYLYQTRLAVYGCAAVYVPSVVRRHDDFARIVLVVTIVALVAMGIYFYAGVNACGPTGCALPSLSRISIMFAALLGAPYLVPSKHGHGLLRALIVVSLPVMLDGLYVDGGRIAIISVLIGFAAIAVWAFVKRERKPIPGRKVVQLWPPVAAVLLTGIGLLAIQLTVPALISGTAHRFALIAPTIKGELASEATTTAVAAAPVPQATPASEATTTAVAAAPVPQATPASEATTTAVAAAPVPQATPSPGPKSNASDVSITFRFTTGQLALKLFAEHPFAGMPEGRDIYSFYNVQTYRTGGYRPVTIHIFYLELMARGGVLLLLSAGAVYSLAVFRVLSVPDKRGDIRPLLCGIALLLAFFILMGFTPFADVAFIWLALVAGLALAGANLYASAESAQR